MVTLLLSRYRIAKNSRLVGYPDNSTLTRTRTNSYGLDPDCKSLQKVRIRTEFGL